MCETGRPDADGHDGMMVELVTAEARLTSVIGALRAQGADTLADELTAARFLIARVSADLR